MDVSEHDAEVKDLPARRPSRLGLYLPFGLLFTVVIAWSVFWVFASRKTGEVMDEAFAREALAGRDWSCPQRGVSGYPFRIEVTCEQPTFVSRVEGNTGTGSLGRLLVQARAVEPTRAIATLKGPLTYKNDLGSAEFDWADAKTSLATDTRTFSDFSVDIDRLTFSFLRGDQAPVIGGAHRISMTLAQDGPGVPGAADYKLVAKLDGLTFGPLDAASGNAAPLTLELQAVGTKLPVPPPTKGPLLAEAWRLAGGALHIVLFDLSKGTIHVKLTGDVGLDETHRATGRFDADFQGIDTLAAQFLGKSVAGFVRAGRLPMLLTGGKLFIGPIPIASLPPLY